MRVFGKVAKGLLGSEQGGDRIAAEVEKLLQRVADGVLAEDRQEAVSMLSDLVAGDPQAQKALGMTGLPVLCAVLRDDRGDVEMLRGTLECLTSAVAPSTKQGPNERSAGMLNAELFARGQNNVALLLGLLDDEPAGVNDFYVRYHTVQLLTAMAAGGSHRVQEAILAAPMGVVRLMDLVGDVHEVIRNEALLLLVGLTRTSPDIQRIAAFEGAFERLLGIIREEGGANGGIVVQDCLEMVNNLLRNNPGNQLMFREMGHLGVLSSMLVLPQASGRKLPRQKATNLLCLIDSVAVLLATARANQKASGKEDQRDANVSALLKAGTLERLLALSLQEGTPTVRAIRVQALRCIAQMVSGSAFGQELLMSSSLTWMPTPLPALLGILRLALHAQEAAERSAAEAVLKGFCRGNADGQSMLAATLMPAGDHDDTQAASTTFGGELVKTLGDSESGAGSRAAGVLATILDGNAACKARLLSMPLEIASPSSAPPQLLLPLCVSHLADAIFLPGEGHQYAAAVLLRLLVTWLRDCPAAVQSFLATASHLPFLVDVVTGRKGKSSAAVAGLAAVLLAECILYNEQVDTKASAPSASTVLDVVTTRIGLTAFFDSLEGLKADQQFMEASSGPQAHRPLNQAAAATHVTDDEESDGSPSTSPRTAQREAPENPFDHELTQWILRFSEGVRQRVAAGQSGHSGAGDAVLFAGRSLQGASDAEQLANAKALISALEREVENLQARNGALAEQNSGQAQGYAKGSSALLPEQNPDSRARLELERRLAHAEGRAQVLEEELSIVQERSKGLEEKLMAAARDAQEAQADASKFESDLKALSGAYANLESHTFQLEAQLREQQAAANGEGIASEEVERRVAEAEGASEDQLNDLLICLGQEEQKVAILQEKLEELGIDCDPLLKEVKGNEDMADDSE